MTMEFFDQGDGTISSFSMNNWIDWHAHFRENEMTKMVAGMVKIQCGGALAMPNLKPPITTAAMQDGYYMMVMSHVDARYAHAAPDDLRQDPGVFQLHTALYLTDKMDPVEIMAAAAKSGRVFVKYYPAGLTTNSDAGVVNPASLWTPGHNAYECLRALADCGGTLMLHGADGKDEKKEELDPYDQEKYFFRNSLPRIIQAHSTLKISCEHISTAWAAGFLLKYGGSLLGCSITAHHLALTRAEVYRGGFHPNDFCQPVIQTKEHREALRALVKKGLPFVWAGTDLAPHPTTAKYKDCCASGIFTGHASSELYAETFYGLGIVDKLEDFTSNGTKFFGVRPPEGKITLVRKPWKVPKEYTTEKGEVVVPFRAGEEIGWQVVR